MSGYDAGGFTDVDNSAGGQIATERRRNLKNAFAISSRFNLANKRVLLVDDVLTTGSTLAVCSEKLLEAGAASVDIMTVARG